jgi:Microtubule-binding protein MIP-T3 C-terminal region
MIQSLCQSTLPLGKCMDLIAEDIAMMTSEKDKWQVHQY